MSSVLPVPVATHAHCAAFASAAEALARRRVADISEQELSAFQDLGWIEWQKGAVRVTPLGQMALIRIQGRFAEPA